MKKIKNTYVNLNVTLKLFFILKNFNCFLKCSKINKNTLIKNFFKHISKSIKNFNKIKKQVVKISKINICIF